MIISHDLGTTGDKATLVSNDGEVLAAVTSAYGTDFGPRGKAEQDPEDWWTALCAATRELLGRASVRAEDVEVVSFSGQMMGAVLLDRSGAPVRPAIIWADTRSVAQTATLVDRVGMAEGYKITGHRLNPTYSLSKIMWVRDQEPEVFSRARTVVLAKDFVAYRLTGVLATDPSDASSTNAYDQAAGEWSTELIEAADLPRSLFPDIVPSTAVIGHVTADAAEATGLVDRDAGGDGRRRRSDGGPRCGHHLARVRRVHLSRLLVLGLGGGRRTPARPADAQHDLQPRAARPVRPDGDDAGRRRVAGMGDRCPRTGSGRPVRPVAGRGRGRAGERGRPLLPAPPAG